MARQNIGIGAAPNDGTGDTLRVGGDKINDNFIELYGFGNFRGAYDASVNAYPSSGGSGTAGAIQAGDEWYVSVSGDLDINGLGVTTVFYGALIKALVSTPGTDKTKWRVVQ